MQDAGAQRTRGLGGPPRGFAADGARVGEQLVERPVAGDPARRQYIVGELGGEEASRSLAVGGPVAGHVQQRGWRSPPDGRNEKVAIYRGAIGALHGAHVRATPNPDDIFALAGV